MSTQKLQGLHAALESQKIFTSEQFVSWMEDGELLPRAKNLGGDQVLICEIFYSAVFSIENFTSDPALLMAVVSAWLIDNDTDREDRNLAKPSIDVDRIDRDRFDVEIQMSFVEPIQLIKDDAGPLNLYGQSWAMTTATVTEVTSAAVGDDQEKPTDKRYNRGDPLP